MFPMSDEAVRQLEAEPYERLFDRLAADGWVEREEVEDTGTRWAAIHDVLVDQILLCYLTDHSATAEIFVDRLLTHACQVACLDSAIYTLQRLAGQPPLNALNWPDMLSRQMAAEPAAWRRVRRITIRTSLLNPAQIVTLLQRHPEIWDGAEQEIDFQNALGWLARQVVKGGQDPLSESQRETLISWIARAGSVVQKSNFVLTWGLRLAPDAIRAFALEWILTRPALLQTHYLMVAWLESGLPADEIRTSVEQWCRQFSRDLHLSFIVRAWLDAKGDLPLVRSSIQAWLAKHATDAQAQFVYRAWLDAKGDLPLVRSSIQAWLAEHATDADAEFVFKGWLEAGGDFQVVREPTLAWLHRNTKNADAVYVTKFIASQRELPIQAVSDILAWCRTFPQHEDAIWRLARLNRHLQRSEVAEEVCDTTESVVDPILSVKSPLRPVTRGQVTILLLHLLNLTRNGPPVLQNRVNGLLVRWLRDRRSFGRDLRVPRWVQFAHYFARVAYLIETGEVDTYRDRPALERFLNWVDAWDGDRKPMIRGMLDDLKRDYPLAELWDIVRFD